MGRCCSCSERSTGGGGNDMRSPSSCLASPSIRQKPRPGYGRCDFVLAWPSLWTPDAEILIPTSFLGDVSLLRSLHRGPRFGRFRRGRCSSRTFASVHSATTVCGRVGILTAAAEVPVAPRRVRDAPTHGLNRERNYALRVSIPCPVGAP